MNKTEDHKLMYEIRERLATIETSLAYMNEHIHTLRKELSKKDNSPFWLKIVCALNTGVFAWLTVLTYLLFNN